jgi:hypothetical protein
MKMLLISLALAVNQHEAISLGWRGSLIAFGLFNISKNIANKLKKIWNRKWHVLKD